MAILRQLWPIAFMSSVDQSTVRRTHPRDPTQTTGHNE
jgi:hypothetical protein